MPRKGYRKPVHEARTIPVNVRLTPSEKEFLLKCVAASDVSGVADYIRLLILGFEIKPRKPKTHTKLVIELATLNRKLASIDNNINQIARAANSGFPQSDIYVRREIDENRKLRAQAAAVLSKVTLRR